jgi:NAD(P)-dependent dehydrogenase (short-subunit alcohol dehydrogenase family)
MEGLNGKKILVIGSATGIGASTVARLADEGAKVVAADINVSGAEAVAEKARAQGGTAQAVACDIADEGSVASAVAYAADAFGGLDGAFVNAAEMRAILSDGDVLEVSMEIFDRTVAVNLRGHVLATRAVLPHLLKAGGGSIIYTSSGAAYAGEATRVSYACTKAALLALSRHVAARWGREGVTANVIAPGFVLTPEMQANGLHADSPLLKMMVERTPSTRIGKVEDIAAMVAYLMSDDARWINGAVHDVNGGGVMR